MSVPEAALQRRVGVDRRAAAEVVHGAGNVGRGAGRVRRREPNGGPQLDRDRRGRRRLRSTPGIVDRLVIEGAGRAQCRLVLARRPTTSRSAVRACGWTRARPCGRRAPAGRRSRHGRCPTRPQRSTARRTPGSGTDRALPPTSEDQTAIGSDSRARTRHRRPRRGCRWHLDRSSATCRRSRARRPASRAPAASRAPHRRRRRRIPRTDNRSA